MSTTFSVGDLTIHRIVEMVEPYGRALDMMPALTQELLDENRHWLEPHALGPGDFIMLTMQSYIVRTPHHTILVDSCLGNHKPRPHGAWNMKTDDTFMRGLAALNLSVDDIDYVMCTHLHADHVGWNTRLVDGRWVPTFPNARYVFSRDEHAALQKRHAADGYPAYTDSVLPIVEAGRADLVGNDFQLGDHVRILPDAGTYGKSCCILFRQQARRCGDDGRPDALASADALPEPCFRAPQGRGAGRGDLQGISGTVLRHADAVLHDPFSAAVFRADQALGRRLSDGVSELQSSGGSHEPAAGPGRTAEISRRKPQQDQRQRRRVQRRPNAEIEQGKAIDDRARRHAEKIRRRVQGHCEPRARPASIP